MTRYFMIDELCYSETALKNNIINKPTPEQIINLNALIDNVLQPLRCKYGHAITVNSGFRCEELNRIVGGASKSKHLTGKACDITVGSKDKNQILYNMLIHSDIQFDRVINEYDYSWLHVEYDNDSIIQRRLHFALG